MSLCFHVAQVIKLENLSLNPSLLFTLGCLVAKTALSKD